MKTKLGQDAELSAILGEPDKEAPPEGDDVYEALVSLGCTAAEAQRAAAAARKELGADARDEELCARGAALDGEAGRREEIMRAICLCVIARSLRRSNLRSFGARAVEIASSKTPRNDGYARGVLRRMGFYTRPLRQNTRLWELEEDGYKTHPTPREEAGYKNPAYGREECEFKVYLQRWQSPRWRG